MHIVRAVTKLPTAFEPIPGPAGFCAIGFISTRSQQRLDSADIMGVTVGPA